MEKLITKCVTLTKENEDTVNQIANRHHLTFRAALRIVLNEYAELKKDSVNAKQM